MNVPFRSGHCNIRRKDTRQNPAWLLLLTLFVLVNAAVLRAQDTEGDNPTGQAGEYNGQITTAGSYDPYTTNIKRSVTDLVVPASNGTYPLAFSRTYNSLESPVGSDTAYFGDGGNWRHSYMWTAFPAGPAVPSLGGLAWSVAYPDGAVVTFRSGRPGQVGDSYLRGPSGTSDRLELTGGTGGGTPKCLHLSDGGIVNFNSPDGWHAGTIIDPYGAVTKLGYAYVATQINGIPSRRSYLSTITEPGGRTLTFSYDTVTYRGTYINGGNTHDYTWVVLSQIQASTGQTVTYHYVTRRGDNSQYHDDGGGDQSHPWISPYYVLASVSYDSEPSITGTGVVTASYTYAGAPPAVLTAHDPHYAGAMVDIKYSYANGLEEQNNGTDPGRCVSHLSGLEGPNNNSRTETRGDKAAGGADITRQFVFNENQHATPTYQWINYPPHWASTPAAEDTDAKNAQITSYTDFEGNPTYLTYYGDGDANGKGNLRAVTDALGNHTGYSHEPYTGKVTTVGLHDGRTRKSLWYYKDLGSPGNPLYGTTDVYDPAILPYYLWQTIDERGHATNYTRRPNDGLVSQIDYPDGSQELFYYTGFTRDGGLTSYSKIGYQKTKLGAQIYYGYGSNPNNPNQASQAADLLTSVTRYYDDGTGTMRSETTYFEYDAFDRLKKTTDPRNVVTTFTYNARHQLTRSTHAADGTHADCSYDDLGNCTDAADELGHNVHTTYDEYRRPTSVTVPVNAGGVASRTVQSTYDRRDTNGSVYAPATSHTSGAPSQTILPSGKGSLTTFDANGRPFYQLTGLRLSGGSLQPADGYTYSHCDRDALGRVIYGYDVHGYATTTEYDECGRVKRTLDPNGHESTWAYYPAAHAYAGLLQTVSTPGNSTANAASIAPLVTTYTAYDNLGRPTATTDSASHAFSSAYDLGGNLTSQSDGSGTGSSPVGGGSTHAPTGYTFDGLGRPVRVNFQNGSYEQSSYNAAGNPAAFRNRKGNTQAFAYDGRNRSQGYTWDDGLTPGVTMGYDAASRLTSLGNGYASQTLTYDDAGGLRTDLQYVDGGGTLPAFTYEYDADGLQTKVTDPDADGAATTYNARGQITASQAINPAAPGQVFTLGAYVYDGDWLLQRYLGNGGYTGYHRQPNGRIDVTQQYNYNTGQNISWRTYGYLPNGQLSWTSKAPNPNASALENGRGDSFYYYADGSLNTAYHEAQAVQSGTYQGQSLSIETNAQGDSFPRGPATPQRYEVHAYDGAGNWSSVTTQAGTATLSPTATNGYTGFGYDPAGNTTSANGLTYQYDAENHLIRADWPGQHGVIFRYDAAGRCCVRNVDNVLTYFYHANGRVMEERNGAGQRTVSYLYGPGGETVCRLDVNRNALYYHYDARGYVTHLTDPGCNVVEQYQYDAFGTPYVYDGTGTVYRGQTSAYGNRQLFNGAGGYEWYPEIGVYHAGARDYLPALGRWLQPDPIGQAGGLNVYAYCGNDPVSESDPSGLWFDRNGNETSGPVLHHYGAGAFHPPASMINPGTTISGFSDVGDGRRVYIEVSDNNTGEQGYATNWEGNNAVIEYAPPSIGRGIYNGAVGAFMSLNPMAVGLMAGGRHGGGNQFTDGGWNRQSIAEIGTQIAAPIVLGAVFRLTLAGAVEEAVGGEALAAKGSGNTAFEKMIQAGEAADRGGLTKAGRALEKHGSRGGVFPKAAGNLAAKNAQGQQVLREILSSRNQTNSPNRFGGKDVFNVDTGQGVRYNAKGEMMGFLEP